MNGEFLAAMLRKARRRSLVNGKTLRQTLVDLAEGKTTTNTEKQNGRHVKRPKRKFNEGLCGGDLLVDELKDVFEANRAPNLWIDNAEFIWQCLLIPSTINGVTMQGDTITFANLFEERGKIHMDKRVLNAAKLAHLVAQNPMLFCCCIETYRQRANRLKRNPKLQAEIALVANPELWDKKAEVVADVLKKDGVAASAKSVEHARASLRRKQRS